MADILTSGSTFPTTELYTRRPFWLSSLGLWCQYDGTRWLSAPIPFIYTSETSLSATNTEYFRIPTLGYNIYLASNILATTYVATTNDGTHNWTIGAAVSTTAFASPTTIHSFTTGSDTPSTFTVHDDTPDSAAPASTGGVIITATKNNSPGNLFSFSVSFFYQLIITT